MANAPPLVVIVGAESLLGREVRDAIESEHIPARVKLISAEEREPGEAILARHEEEAVLMASLEAAELKGAKAVLLAGAPESSEKAMQLASGPGAPLLIDVSGALDDKPAVRIRAPMVEEAAESAPIYVIAHPAAIVLALFLRRLAKTGGIRRVVAQIFEPVSERGQKGIDELQQQTVGLLSFQKLKKDVFDTQVSFNLLPQYGSEAATKLEDVETTIERHLVTLLATEPGIPMPSFRVAHAPVFHGYSFSIWVEFESRPEVEHIAGALAAARIEVRTGEEEPPSNVGAAGQSGITVGAIAHDRNDPRGCWFWVVADNLRIVAENAAEVLREALG